MDVLGAVCCHNDARDKYVTSDSMLTASQMCVLYPGEVTDQFNGAMRRSPKRCLFGSPDPLETRRLLEEQFLADREMMIRKYGFDILTSRPVASICALEAAEDVCKEDAPKDFVIPLVKSTDEEAQDRSCSPETEVRLRPLRHNPYNRQTRITGKQCCVLFWGVIV